MFSNFLSSLGGDGRRHKKFTDPEAWHNLFREYITCKVTEQRFRCLFSGDMGRPNVPVRMLAGMMILKESSGWSDERLFEEIEFNILAMSALGMNNASDEAPCAATYYNFRKALYEYQLQTGEDLIGDMFRKLTQTQAKLFGVHGKFTRMVSKLIGSIICKSSRFQLIISVLLALFQRQQIERFSQEAFKRRNNVEAIIFQLSYFTRKNKTRYGGKIKHQWWAYNRFTL